MNSCLNNDFIGVYPKDQQTELTSLPNQYVKLQALTLGD